MPDTTLEPRQILSSVVGSLAECLKEDGVTARLEPLPQDLPDGIRCCTVSFDLSKEETKSSIAGFSDRHGKAKGRELADIVEQFGNQVVIYKEYVPPYCPIDDGDFFCVETLPDNGVGLYGWGTRKRGGELTMNCMCRFRGDQ